MTGLARSRCRGPRRPRRATASVPRTVRPDSIRSDAAPNPQRCGRIDDDASSGTRPILTNRTLSLAFSPVTMRSNGRIIVSPTPIAGPLTAATIGFVDRTSSTQSRTRAGAAEDASPDSCASNTAEMSAPAQKPRPAPVTTTAPTDASASAASIASTSSALIRGVQAFSFSGRFSVSSTISSRCSWRICS